MLTNGDDIQILYLQQLILCVDTGRDTVEVGLLDDTLVAIVTDGEERGTSLGTAAQRYVILLDKTRTGGLLEPIGVSGGSGACDIEVFIHRDTVEGGNTLGIIAPVVTIT